MTAPRAPVRPAQPAAAEESPSAALLRTLRAVARDAPGLVSDRVQLLSLEMRRAKMALTKIIIFGVIAGILALTAWMALWAGLIVAAIVYGFGWPWVVLAAIVLNLVVAYVLLKRAQALGPLLALPATVRRLTVAQAGDPPPPSGSP